MALTEVNAPGPPSDPARPAKTFHDSRQPHDLLGRLSLLYREAGRDLALSQFLARSPLVCVMLMPAGGLALLWAGSDGGGTLKADFAWAALVLVGVVAMTRNFIRGYARTPGRVPLKAAATRLKTLLLYTGMAWGAGAVLIMPALPTPALAFSFATAPSLALALVLRDPKGVPAFAMPAALITACAALLGAWPHGIWVAAAILTAAVSIMTLPMLHRAMHHPAAE